mmetsp:Transcript_3908/g.8992  ORF Transcript_3908/g.8992 Transcript_3908/m.8992 type:complete len:245 (-) Transcript_3908:3514-4248(-)
MMSGVESNLDLSACASSKSSSSEIISMDGSVVPVNLFVSSGLLGAVLLFEKAFSKRFIEWLLNSPVDTTNFGLFSGRPSLSCFLRQKKINAANSSKPPTPTPLQSSIELVESDFLSFVTPEHGSNPSMCPINSQSTPIPGYTLEKEVKTSEAICVPFAGLLSPRFFSMTPAASRLTSSTRGSKAREYTYPSALSKGAVAALFSVSRIAVINAPWIDGTKIREESSPAIFCKPAQLSLNTAPRPA